MDKYGIFIKTLGKGAYGSVELHRTSSKSYAIKFMDNEIYSDSDVNGTAILEAAIMSSMEHPNIISLIHANFDGKYSALVMPAANSDFRNYTVTNTKSTTNIIYQMIRSVAYIHSQGIIHKDIKPDNFFISRRYQCCLVNRFWIV